MNNRQVAHLWANQSRQEAKGSHFYFEGDTIYSYGAHFPIARHYLGAVLFTSRSYSNTTAKHKGHVRQACNHLESFTVENPALNPSGKDVRNYAESIKTLSAALARARDPQWKLESLQREINEANRFCEKFGFQTRFSMPDETTLAALREKSRLESIRKAKATAARNAKIEAENAEAIAKWIAGESASLPYSVQKVFLRVRQFSINGESSDGSATTWTTQLETSKGARVPIAEAEKTFRFIMLKRESGWHRNGETFRIGDFHLDAVNEFGIVAGCHRIAWDEIERFAKTQNWI